jgi:hypothetical protein
MHGAASDVVTTQFDLARLQACPNPDAHLPVATDAQALLASLSAS